MHNPPITERVASVVLAGGQGTRLFPLTQCRCKPAVAFGGRYRLIDIPLSNSLNSKIPYIFVVSQYFASHLNQHLAETYHGDLFKPSLIKTLCPEETPQRKVWFEGTADAVRQNLSHLLETPADYFLILSGDQLYNMDYAEILRFAMDTHADVVISAIPVKEAEAKRMGLLKTSSSLEVTEFIEKPQDAEVLRRFLLPDATHYLGSMGIYVFKRSALISLLKEKGEDFGRHLLPAQVRLGKTYAFVFNGYWEDIGTIASYYEANLALTMHQNCLDIYNEKFPIYTHPAHLPSPMIKHTLVKNSLLSEGSIIEADEVSHCLLGLRSFIKKGTVIKDTVVVGNQTYIPTAYQNLPKEFSIGEGCVIQKAIIDEHVFIGNRVQLTNQKNLQHMEGKNGVFIRDGIIIVTTGTSLPDGFVL